MIFPLTHEKISIFSWWISKPCLRTPHAARDATSLELWSAINPIHQKKYFLRGSSYWQIIHAEIVVSLFYFSMVSQYTNNLIYIYACLYVFCLSACVSWESINLKLNTPGHYLQSRKTPASWNHKATKHPPSRRVTSFFPKDGSASQILHDFPTYFNIPIMKSNEEHTRLHNKKLDGHIISTMAGLAHEPSSSCQHRETQGHSKPRRPQHAWRSGCRSIPPPISKWEKHVEYSTWLPSKSQSKADKNA